MAVDYAVAVPTFIGSVMSTIASSLVLLSYATSSRKRHFRHWLILNLAIADFINALNNSISGLAVLKEGHDVTPGTGCILNAWIGQLSVQAGDFSVLAIALVALWIINQRAIVSAPDANVKKLLYCSSVWIVPVCTSTIGFGLKLYGPVSGNWCWIEPQHLGLRYALGHGWRIAIILTTVGIYVYVFVIIKRRFAGIAFFPHAASNSGQRTVNVSRGPGGVMTIELETTVVVESVAAEHAGTRGIDSSPSTISDRESEGHRPVVMSSKAETATEIIPYTAQRAMPHSYSEIRRIMLLNGYPIIYVILWIPGLLNRLFESLDYSPRWLKILQASTQYVGLANAITYSYNEGAKWRFRAWRAGLQRLYD
ncbi:G protein-coupled glucose receptor regulating Gpa2-domain-containing protein [Aspergillus caelatus]|uniref:G protein-coupled glucose receptor regulating Gpa2-domain-containing protein n=1 Tax=Aspergillus caelatus TaxID=61420 RepID=A0A5N6ZHE2_9EURO|nr:G protein-coupled glucose receptor regulating Gpa2-domain-containing protein [Aspergillus caelatus]KAE8357084.1 G protein-coupled glucose receptor regulating Gpa2-domain-containing protein [Aspergillus caelatus]